MSIKNNVTEFILLGLTDDPAEQKIIFVIFIILYVATILGNLLIIVTIKTSHTLESPMYFFLTYLSLSDACFSTTTTPKFLIITLSEKKTISFSGCMTQIFALHFFGCLETLILIMMSYDRYVAICKPLHYTAIMNRRVCSILIGIAWFGSFLHSSTQLLLTLNLPFCGPDVIDHFFCDLQPLMKLACTDTYFINLLFVSNSGAICTLSFVMLMASYMVILYSLRSKGAEGRLKALSTCSSHILVVTLFYGPCIFIYTRPQTTFPVDKSVSVFYTVVTPLLNPLIYTLRNKEVKDAMRKLWSHRVTPRGK
ncbi:olfactory receptor 4C11-like [Tachyglossus aculeatus]|uniref:olfactory receptor 4C11-like n=1 Tax=Tachyglossus aculeatus TaxID=9261 RepID=UPI0018F480F1|nr:olfactory receptor 4C11-like [Tachyglossus aculeatus]